MQRGLAMRKLSVCPSVRLSVKRVDCDKTKERSVLIFIPQERTLSLVQFYTEYGRFAFLSAPLVGGLGATYDDYLRLIGKREVDLLLVLIELFARCYG